MLFSNPTQQSPKAYDLANLGGAVLAGRIGGAASVAVRQYIRQALQDSAYLYLIHPAETAQGLTDANLTFGYRPCDVMRYGADPSGQVSSRTAFNNAYNVAQKLAANTSYASPAIIRVPRGKYLIDSPGLDWTSQNDIYMHGDGFGSSQLIGGAGPYTILTLSADTGAGTTGLNISLRDFAIKTANVAGQHGMQLADYLYGSVRDIAIQASGNALTCLGMANVSFDNVYALSWESASNVHSALNLQLDTHGVGNGPLTFKSCWFETNGAPANAVQSKGTFSTAFEGCTVIANGANVSAVVVHDTGDDVTWINPYSESSYNSVTNNTGSLFYLGLNGDIISFTLIGGHIFNGNGINFLAKAVTSARGGSVIIKNATFANFATAAISYTLAANFYLNVENVSAPGGAAKVIDPALGGNAPTGAYVQKWVAPAMFTTGVASAAYVANTGTNVVTGSTYDGYTIQQVVRALRLAGILA